MTGSLSKNMPFMWQDMIWHINNERRWYLILIPREHYKSSFITCGYPLYRICENENFTGGVIHAVLQEAIRPVKRARTILESHQQLINNFGPFKPLDTRGSDWREDEFRIARTDPTNTLMTMFAKGTGSRMTGRHCDLLIFDDLEDDQTTTTPEVRKKVLTWFRTITISVVNRVATDGRPGQIIFVGTRKHPDDIYSKILQGDIRAGELVAEQYYETEQEAEQVIEAIANEIQNMEIIR